MSLSTKYITLVILDLFPPYLHFFFPQVPTSKDSDYCKHQGHKRFVHVMSRGKMMNIEEDRRWKQQTRTKQKQPKQMTLR